MDDIGSDNGWSTAEWVRQALKHADMAQVDLSRQLQTRGLRTVDKSAVNKILKGERRLMADEMLAISAITKFPMPMVPGVLPSPQHARETPSDKLMVGKGETSRPTGHIVAEDRLGRLMAKMFELLRPKGMTPVVANNLAATILSVCRRRADQREDEPDEAQFSRKREL